MPWRDALSAFANGCDEHCLLAVDDVVFDINIGTATCRRCEERMKVATATDSSKRNGKRRKLAAFKELEIKSQHVNISITM